MNIICPNCKTKLGCSCQKKRASNGAEVCSKCLKSYEQNLLARTSSSPSNVTVFYNKPGNK